MGDGALKKVHGIWWAGLFSESYAKHVTLYGNEISVSLFWDKRPEKMFQELKRIGFEVTEDYKGIYYVSGIPGMPTQMPFCRQAFQQIKLYTTI